MASIQERALAYLRGEMDEGTRDTFEEELTRSEELRAELERSRELLEVLDAANEEATVRAVNACLQEAIKLRASDIHLLVSREESDPDGAVSPERVEIWFRIDGRLQEWAHFPKERHLPMVNRWKVMSEMNIAEQRLPQDGRIAVRYEGKPYDVRVCVLPCVTGERITARILDRNNVLLGLDRLGLTPLQIAALKRIIDCPRGMALVGGFEGAGKTTLLYSLLSEVSRPPHPRRNCLSIEDPVEYLLPGVTQARVHRGVGMTFEAGLRSILRSDPEVVYCSQMRSLECAELCVELALTSALVLSQLHVSSALMLVQRLREMGVVNFLIGYTLQGAIGVRLVRRVCPDCRIEYIPSQEELRKAGFSATEDGPFVKGAGCATCRNTGFLGRIGLFEVLELDQNVRRMIVEEVHLDTIWYETFGRSGGSLWDDARDKVRQGLTTVEEVTWALADYPHPRGITETALWSVDKPS